MPLTRIRRGLMVIGLTALIAAPSLAIGSIWSRRQHIMELKDAALAESVLADTSVRRSIVDHLSRYQAEDALIWTPRGDATLGVVGALAGIVLIAASLKRRLPPA
jgi:hypothetical protein